ncbi:hypothetical protein [Nitrosophilus alvini]|uniref:hypothetical protein n=1 Tax=Nitrosophilus alvini TaxID=2714855 RepID=UPI00190B18C0|nr:hypothetical protein [Nitrosophilus alvini]
MNKKIESIIDKMKLLEKELLDEIEKEEKKFGFKVETEGIVFNKEIRKSHRKYAKNLFRYILDAPFLYILTAPVIYGAIFPAIFLDLYLFLYQMINFRVYGIKRVKRSDYIIFDRQYLEYLNPIEKLNCMYCSYFNGLMAYATEVSARTELFWCPIKHAKKVPYIHRYYTMFISYGDAKEYREKLEKLRRAIKEEG